VSTPRSLRVVINVADLDPVRGFYVDLLGFAEVDGWDRGPDDRGSLVEICPGGIVEIVGHGPSYDQPAYDALAIELDSRAEVDRRCAGLVLRGVAVDGPSDKPWGHWSASVHDPAGMEVVLYAASPS